MGETKAGRRGVLPQLLLTGRMARTALSSRLAGAGLHPGQDELLLLLGENGPLPLRLVAERLAVRQPTVTKTVARMAREGLVEKLSPPGEPRRVVLALTAHGQAQLSAVREARRAVEREALAGLKRKEARTLRKLLRRVEQRLAADDGAGLDASDESG